MTDTKKRFSPLALLLSGLLNLLLVIILLNEELIWTKALLAPPREVEVDLVPEQPKPPAAKPKPQPPKPQPPPPQPQQAELPRPPQEEPPPPPPPPPPPKPPPPQLIQAPLAKRSATGHRASSNGAEGSARAMAITPGPALSVVPRGAAKRGPAGGNGPEGSKLTQSEQDFILSQIMQYWHVDTHVPEARGLVLEAQIIIEADGTLASPLNKDDPWNPEAVISGYAAMARLGYSYRRQAIEAFLLALRLCQPLKLPPGGTWPRVMTLRFAFDDM